MKENGRTVACRLVTLLKDQSSLATIESAVQRVHRVVLFATEAIALLVHEDIDHGVAPASMLPLNEHGKVNSMFLAIETNERVKEGTPNRVDFDRVRCAFRRIHGTDTPLVQGDGLSQLVASEARYYIAHLTTGLVRHYRKRVHRYCQLRLRLPDAAYKPLDKAGRKAQASRVLRATTDVCRPGWQAAGANATDTAFVAGTRTMLGLDAVAWDPLNARGQATRRTLSDVLKKTPQFFLPGMAAINRALATAGVRTFRLLPMRTALAPRFVTVDQLVLKQIGLVGADHKRKLEADALERRAKQRPFAEEVKARRAAHAELARSWKQADLVAKGAGTATPPKEEGERRKAVTAAMEADIKAMQANPVFAALRDGAAAEKRVAFEAVFNATGALSKADAEAWQLGLRTDGVSARLLLDAKTAKAVAKRTREGARALPRRGLITVERLREALLGSETAPALPPQLQHELDGLAPQEQNEALNEALGPTGVTIVGGDPGARELLVLSNPDLEWRSRAHRVAALGPRPTPSPSLRASPDAPPPPPCHPSDRHPSDRLPDDPLAHRRRCRYTQPQRREATRPARYFLKPKHSKGGAKADPERQRRAAAARAYRHAHVDAPEAVLEAERSLSAHCSKGPTAAALLAYCRARATVLAPTLLPWHAHPQRRWLRWKRFLTEQRSLSTFCDRIRAMGRLQQRGSGVDSKVVIAYGAWALSSGRPGKGLPPCIGKGLLRKLSGEFVVVAVPEHFTSQRCFHCGGECGNHAYLAERDRRAQSDERLEARLAGWLERAETTAQRDVAHQWYDRAMGRPCEIRGLRFCNGCQRCLNRDANSAPQMAVQLKRLVLGLAPLYRLSDEDGRLQAMRAAIDAEDDA